MAAYRTAARLFPGLHLPLIGMGMEYQRMNNLHLAEQMFWQVTVRWPTEVLHISCMHSSAGGAHLPTHCTHARRQQRVAEAIPWVSEPDLSSCSADRHRKCCVAFPVHSTWTAITSAPATGAGEGRLLDGPVRVERARGAGVPQRRPRLRRPLAARRPCRWCPGKRASCSVRAPA